jgi:pimeloyl-ACP methyl ester carboxylesterase
VLDDVLDTTEYLSPLDPPPCPITIAWGRADRVLPLKTIGARARELVPGARFVEFDDVGHVAMFDDPRLVADTILETTGG